jgi:hypothetical protein
MRAATHSVRAYPLPHQANEYKLVCLRALYQTYAVEYRYHVKRLWADFRANRLEVIPPIPLSKGNPDRVSAVGPRPGPPQVAR